MLTGKEPKLSMFDCGSHDVMFNALQIAEGHAKTPIKDCVITVPPFFGHVERHALMNAASSACARVECQLLRLYRLMFVPLCISRRAERVISAS